MATSGPSADPDRELFPTGQNYRSGVIECDAEALERMRKRADFSILGGFSIECDEPESVGGDNSAPPPMAYFAAAVLF